MYKILICDDETDIRNALNIYLSAQGYETVLCSNGQEALDAVAKGGIGLVLLDIMMPVMDGITVLSKLRKTSNVPVILLTAKGEDTDKVLGLDVGADDYITKPFNPMEVLARVKSQRAGIFSWVLLWPPARSSIVALLPWMTVPKQSW